MEGEQAVKVFDLAVKGKSLPAKIEELVPLSFIGAAAVKFYQTKVKLMDQLGMTEAQRKATLRDGQDAGEMLLSIEARIGELIQKEVVVGRNKKTAPDAVVLSDLNMTRGRSHQAQAIHRNPAAVAAVIREARENEDIPTKTAVLKEIAFQKVKAQRERMTRGEKQTVNEALDRFIEMLSQINLGLGEIVENWEHIDADQRNRFKRVALRFAEHIKKLGGRDSWKVSHLIA